MIQVHEALKGPYSLGTQMAEPGLHPDPRQPLCGAFKHQRLECCKVRQRERELPATQGKTLAPLWTGDSPCGLPRDTPAPCSLSPEAPSVLPPPASLCHLQHSAQHPRAFMSGPKALRKISSLEQRGLETKPFHDTVIIK